MWVNTPLLTCIWSEDQPHPSDAVVTCNLADLGFRPDSIEWSVIDETSKKPQGLVKDESDDGMSLSIRYQAAKIVDLRVAADVVVDGERLKSERLELRESLPGYESEALQECFESGEAPGDCLGDLVDADASASLASKAKGQVIFVTRTLVSGNVGGTAGGDALCDAEARAAGLGGGYRALLSTEDVDAKERLSLRGPFVRTGDGRMVASSFLGLITAQAIIDRDAGGKAVSETRFWTGTSKTGKSSGETCDDWTSSRSTRDGTIGNGASAENSEASIRAAMPSWLCFASGPRADSGKPVFSMGCRNPSRNRPKRREIVFGQRPLISDGRKLQLL